MFLPTLYSQLKEERLKERLRLRLNKLQQSADDRVAPVPQESSAEYDDQQDEKSFDSLASFTSDVSDKVGNAANEASTGVTV